MIFTAAGIEIQKGDAWLLIPGCTGITLFEFNSRLQELQNLLLSAGNADPVALFRKNARFRYLLNRAIAANQADPESLTIEERLILVLPTEQFPNPPLMLLNQFPPEVDPPRQDPYALEEDNLDSVGKFVALIASAHGESMSLMGAWDLAARERAVDLIVMARAIGRARMMPEDREKAYLRRTSNRLREQQKERFKAFMGNSK